MKCCACKREVALGAQRVEDADVEREDFAIRCVYCLALFCVVCSKRHFEARNKGTVRKRVTTTTTEEWLDVPLSAPALGPGT